MKARAHVFVSGLVQGVFFRWETRKNALKNNVKGWVRNLRDGRVEAVFEGEKEDIEKMIKFCEKGPPGAKVEKVEVKWEDYKGEYESFEIIY
ncbi:MAG: acylphosphatase [Candidatus Bathyarchaeia archaeon]|nr:acylphosphatase [Candidatus Bathyarchaeota archaeon]